MPVRRGRRGAGAGSVAVVRRGAGVWRWCRRLGSSERLRWCRRPARSRRLGSSQRLPGAWLGVWRRAVVRGGVGVWGGGAGPGCRSGGGGVAFGEGGHGLDGDPDLLDLVGGVDDPQPGHAVGQRNDLAGTLRDRAPVVVGRLTSGVLGDLATQRLQQIPVRLRAGPLQHVRLDRPRRIVGQVAGRLADRQRLTPRQRPTPQRRVCRRQGRGQPQRGLDPPPDRVRRQAERQRDLPVPGTLRIDRATLRIQPGRTRRLTMLGAALPMKRRHRGRLDRIRPTRQTVRGLQQLDQRHRRHRPRPRPLQLRRQLTAGRQHHPSRRGPAQHLPLRLVLLDPVPQLPLQHIHPRTPATAQQQVQLGVQLILLTDKTRTTRTLGTLRDIEIIRPVHIVRPAHIPGREARLSASWRHLRRSATSGPGARAGARAGGHRGAGG